MLAQSCDELNKRNAPKDVPWGKLTFSALTGTDFPPYFDLTLRNSASFAVKNVAFYSNRDRFTWVMVRDDKSDWIPGPRSFGPE